MSTTRQRSIYQHRNGDAFLLYVGVQRKSTWCPLSAALFRKPKIRSTTVTVTCALCKTRKKVQVLGLHVSHISAAVRLCLPCKGVRPLLSSKFGFAPHCKSRLAASGTAKALQTSRGVRLELSRASMLAPRWRSICVFQGKGGGRGN